MLCKLEKVKRRAARCVTDDYSSYSSVYQISNTLGWRSLEQRRAYACLILFFKIVYGLLKISLPSYICHPIKTTKRMSPMYYIQMPTTGSYYIALWLVYTGTISLLRLSCTLTYILSGHSYAPFIIKCHKPWNMFFNKI